MIKHYLTNTYYHSTLRVSALLTSLVLLFVSGTLSPVSSELSLVTEQYVASVFSATAGVETTELNAITAALTEQRSLLDARETELVEREMSLGIDGAGEAALDISSFLLSALLFVLIVLIVLNYILDFMRAESRTRPQQTVS